MVSINERSANSVLNGNMESPLCCQGWWKQKVTLLFAFASRVLLSQQWGSGNIVIEEYRVQHPTEIYHFGNSSYLADASTQTI